MANVHMICMPYQSLSIPSLSTVLLSTILRENQLIVEESYPYLAFSRICGIDRYQAITEGGATIGLLGELFFVEDEASSNISSDSQILLTSLFGPLSRRRHIRATFTEYCENLIAQVSAPLIGFTTSFNQLMPSLWLARRIKSVRPSTQVVFGGSACTAPMGYAIATAYPEIDFIVSGNGEKVLLALGNLCTGV